MLETSGHVKFYFLKKNFFSFCALQSRNLFVANSKMVKSANFEHREHFQVYSIEFCILCPFIFPIVYITKIKGTQIFLGLQY
jgi:hypothetical protein